MEAMATNKAAIASNNRGHRELVQDEKTGYIIEPSSSNGYASAIKKFTMIILYLLKWGEMDTKN